jgi:hypothetical protein
MPLSNSTVIFLPDVSDVWRWPNPVKTLNAHFLLQNQQWNQRMNSQFDSDLKKKMESFADTSAFKVGVKEKNTKINKITIVKNQKLATQNFLFKMHINVPFGNI